MSLFRRVILIVLDSVGVGSLPDAHEYNDEGSHTLGHIVENIKELEIPNLLKMGLGYTDESRYLKRLKEPIASFGRCLEKSKGKDTTTGHWEISGIVLDKPFPVFESGFPEKFITDFEHSIGSKTIGNFASSGTTVINTLGDEHVRTGHPIVYTSADSVFQIAMHEDIIPIDRQYEICETARRMLKDELAVGRVICRPFVGTTGAYTRTARRKDFALLPPFNVMNAIVQSGKKVISVGKIYDIFAGRGISQSFKTVDNNEGVSETIRLLKTDFHGLLFVNLVDFDMHYGHRRDVKGYAACLESFDKRLPNIFENMNEDDLLIITADHGNDPTWHGTDHTREYIPVLIYGKNISPGINIGTRSSFGDIAATISEALGTKFESIFDSFLPLITKRINN